MSSSSSASAYWKQRNARDKERKALAIATGERMFWRRVADASIASVLPGCSMPACLQVYPVNVCLPNGATLVCNHLA